MGKIIKWTIITAECIAAACLIIQFIIVMNEFGEYLF